MKKSQIILFIALLGSALCVPVAPASAQTWTPTATPSAQWQTVAASADGHKLFAGGLGGVFYFSTNSGSTWNTSTEPQWGSQFGSWNCIASSADGTKLAAINFTAYWISTNSGATWISINVPGFSFFSSVAMSADGTRLVLSDGLINASPGLIYTSTNSGVTLTPNLVPTNDWTNVASSADGTKLVAVSQNFYQDFGLIYASTNSGQSWAVLPGAPTNNLWSAVASSADGGRLIAASQVSYNPSLWRGGVYTSTDFGATWTSNSIIPAQWASVASSADGTRLVAVAMEPTG